MKKLKKLLNQKNIIHHLKNYPTKILLYTNHNLKNYLFY